MIVFSFREFVIWDDYGECQSAVLRYYDGDNFGRTPLKLCGSNLPIITRSSGNVVVFELHVSGHDNWGRFRLDYAAVDILSDSSYPVIGAGIFGDRWLYERVHSMCLPQTVSVLR